MGSQFNWCLLLVVLGGYVPTLRQYLTQNNNIECQMTLKVRVNAMERYENFRVSKSRKPTNFCHVNSRMDASRV